MNVSCHVLETGLLESVSGILNRGKKSGSCITQLFWQIKQGLLGMNKCHSFSRPTAFTDDLSMTT